MRKKYINDDFKWYYTKNGIKMTKTIPGKPQQNGMIERMNMTLKWVCEEYEDSRGIIEDILGGCS